VISRAAFACLQAANVSTFAYAGLTIANAHLLARYGTPQQIDRWVRPMLEGRYFGTMCLSEPERMLMAQKSYAEGGLALGLYAARLLDEVTTAEDETERENSRLLLEVLTPVVKSRPSQWCLEANSLAIQVHGGYGYTRDFNVEQLYRDNRLNAIHEGTHTIHGLDLLGRKVTMDSGAGLRVLLNAITAAITRAGRCSEELRAWGLALRDSAGRVAAVTDRLWSTGEPEAALANSTAYLEGVGHVVLAWIWLEQALAAEGKTGDFYDGKRAAARYFFSYELPKNAAQFDLLASLDRSMLKLSESWF